MKTASAVIFQVTEWKDRAAEFNDFVRAFGKIVENFAKIPNRCLLYDMNSYLWDLRGTLSLLNAFVKWLGNYAASIRHAMHTD